MAVPGALHVCCGDTGILPIGVQGSRCTPHMSLRRADASHAQKAPAMGPGCPRWEAFLL